MKRIVHITLGLIGVIGVIGVIFMLLASLFNKILSNRATTEQKIAKPWLENFIILYVNKCLIFDGDITDFERLSRGELNRGQLQSLIVYLKAYLHKIGQRYEQDDLQYVLNSLPKVWEIHVTGFQSEGAVRAWCLEQNPDGTKEDVDAFITTVEEVDKTSEDWAELSKSLLTSRFSRVFTERHSEGFLSYTDTMLEDYMASTDGGI